MTATAATSAAVLPDDLLELPFDQYTRHQVAREVADAVRRDRGLPSLRVLDVGGSPCLTPRFLPDDQVIVIDVVSGAAPGGGRYVQADGSALSFRDGSFDLVVSLDSLEHVPPDRRAAYVSELVRASRGYLLILAPFARRETELAERVLAEFVRVVNQEEQPQLREHREHGLPELDEWVSFLEHMGLDCVTFSSGYVYNWLPMMLLKHYVLALPESDALHRAIDRFYNEALQRSDARSPGYRQAILASRVGRTAALGEVSRALQPTAEVDRLDVIERMEQIGLLLKLADLHLATRKDDRLREDLVAKERHIVNLEAALREAEARVEEGRVQGQAVRDELEGLRGHLRAIQRGRVMRLLRALDRARGRAS